MNIPVLAGCAYGLTTFDDIKDKFNDKPVKTIMDMTLRGTVCGIMAGVLTKAFEKTNNPSYYNKSLTFAIIVSALYNIQRKYR